jgi:simple sugar transport system ATP-binding protein
MIISTELDEVMELADRIAVLYKGKLVGIVPAGTGRDVLGLMMAGLSPEEALSEHVHPGQPRSAHTHPGHPPSGADAPGADTADHRDGPDQPAASRAEGGDHA